MSRAAPMTSSERSPLVPGEVAGPAPAVVHGAQTEAPQEPRRYFIAVGVDRYLREGVPDLDGCSEDALDVLRTAKVIGVGMHRTVALASTAAATWTQKVSQRIAALVGGEWRDYRAVGTVTALRWILSSLRVTNIRPTRRNILLQLERTLDVVVAETGDGENAVIVFTFSGHARLDDQGKLLMCPEDATDDPDSTIRYQDLVERVGERAPQATLSALLDCCHAGAAHEDVGGCDDHLGGCDDHQGQRDRDVLLASAAAGQKSRACGVEGRYRGVFTWALLRTLEQWRPRDRDQDGVEDGGVNVSREVAMRQTRKIMEGLLVDQMPVLRGFGADDDALLNGLFWSPREEKHREKRREKRRERALDRGSDTPDLLRPAREFSGGIAGLTFSVSSQDPTFPRGCCLAIGPTAGSRPTPLQNRGQVWWSFDLADHLRSGVTLRFTGGALSGTQRWRRKHKNGVFTPAGAERPDASAACFELRLGQDLDTVIGYVYPSQSGLTFWLRDDVELDGERRLLIDPELGFELRYLPPGARLDGTWFRSVDLF